MSSTWMNELKLENNIIIIKGSERRNPLTHIKIIVTTKTIDDAKKIKTWTVAWLVVKKCYYNIFQEQRKWNTRPDNGTKSVSAVVYVKLRLALNHSYPENRKFSVPDVTKRNSQPDASSAIR